MTDFESINVESLSAECIDAKPMDYDWSEHEFGEAWDIVRPDIDDWDAERLASYLDDEGFSHGSEDDDYADSLRDLIRVWYADEDNGQEEPSDLDDWGLERCQSFIGANEIDADDADDSYAESLRSVLRDRMDDNAYGEPMMNYAYPIGRRYDRSAIGSLPACTVVEIDGEPYLALTGGGMDLSWEICESYIRLGFLPPTHFADLPMMAGRGRSDRDKLIIAACRRSLQVHVGWLQGRIERLDRMGDKP